MRKNLLLLFSFLIVQFTFSQKYFDKDWKETTRSNASFYRIMPMKEVGELVLMQDFYMDGTPQFEGYVYKTDEDSYVGDISYYDADGNDETFRQYTNSTENSVLNYYHTNGKIRKRSIYKNGVKNGETNIYGEDGKLLMTGIYAEGKPVKGDFESFNDDYQNDKREDDQINEIENIPTNEEYIKTPTYTPPPPPSTVPRDQAVYVKPIPTSEPKKKVDLKNRKTIALKIFWAKTNKLAQEKLYEIREYDRDLIQQKNYDNNGKLIQTLDEENIEYGHRLKNGIEYEYFLHNNFATGVRSSTIYKDEKKEGKKIAYFPNGKTASETIFKEGFEVGEEIIYKENGEIDKKRTYKKGESYTGNFDDKIGFLKINYNYSNGKKEGEATAKVEDGKIVAKGIYKNNEPFNGTFVVKQEYGDENEFINVENFKKLDCKPNLIIVWKTL